MPRDLFGDVTRPSVSIGNRKWYTVPVSLLTHSLAIAAVVVLPLVAAPFMPGVVTPIADFAITELVPPTPPPAPKRLQRAEPVPDPSIAPLEAPSQIAPEMPPVETSDRVIEGIVGGVDNIDMVLAPPPSKPVSEPPKPVRVGGAVRTPVQTHRVDPVYPPIAQTAGIQGIVIIEATIGADGRVMDARVLRPVHTLLDRAALDAVRQWQYTPSTLNGEPVPVIMTVTVHFTLRR